MLVADYLPESELLMRNSALMWWEGMELVLGFRTLRSSPGQCRVHTPPTPTGYPEYHRKVAKTIVNLRMVLERCMVYIQINKYVYIYMYIYMYIYVYIYVYFLGYTLQKCLQKNQGIWNRMGEWIARPLAVCECCVFCVHQRCVQHTSMLFS